MVRRGSTVRVRQEGFAVQAVSGPSTLWDTSCGEWMWRVKGSVTRLRQLSSSDLARLSFHAVLQAYSSLMFALWTDSTACPDTSTPASAC